MATDAREVLPLLTNLFMLPVWWVALNHVDTLYLELVYSVFTFLASMLYHGCQFAGSSVCVWPMATLKLNDHVYAEGLILVAAVLFVRWPTILMRHVVQITLLLVHVYVKLATDMQGFTVAVTVALVLAGLWRDRRAYRWPYMTAGAVLVVLGLAMYFAGTGEAYFAVHSGWHVASMVAFALILLAVVTVVDSGAPQLLAMTQMHAWVVLRVSHWELQDVLNQRVAAFGYLRNLLTPGQTRSLLHQVRTAA